MLPVLIIMKVLSLAARLAGYGSELGGLVGIFIIVMLPIGILTTLLPLDELANRPSAMEPNSASSSGLWMMSFMVAIKCPPTKYRINEKRRVFSASRPCDTDRIPEKTASVK